MKIQEMKSGILHFNRNVEEESKESLAVPGPERATAEPRPDCELDEPRWSVVSFHRCEGAGLIYRDAVYLLNELYDRNIAGLCIVTDESAGRLCG